MTKFRWTLLSKNGNNFEATLDFVKRIVRLVAFDNVTSTLLLVWTGLNAQVDIGDAQLHSVIAIMT